MKATTAVAVCLAATITATAPAHADDGLIPAYGSITAIYTAVGPQIRHNSQTLQAQIAADPTAAITNTVINLAHPITAAQIFTQPAISATGAAIAAIAAVATASTVRQSIAYTLIIPATVIDGLVNGGGGYPISHPDGIPKYAGGLLNQPYSSTFPSGLHTVNAGVGPALISPRTAHPAKLGTPRTRPPAGRKTLTPYRNAS